MENHQWPSNAMAIAYYGYILKVYDGQLEQGVHFMRRGLRGAKGDELSDAKYSFLQFFENFQ
jgi:hypothetical protein